VLVRTDAAEATHAFAHHLAAAGVEFSVGAYLHHFDIPQIRAQLPEQAWTPSYQVRTPRAGQQAPIIEPHDGAWIAEATGLVDLSAWPVGTRLILRRERPYPGAQLRITDIDGHRIVGMLTNIPEGSWQIWSYVTVAAPASKTGEASGRPRTPGYVTCPTTT
jgi:hypothetical protein